MASSGVKDGVGVAGWVHTGPDEDVDNARVGFAYAGAEQGHTDSDNALEGAAWAYRS